MSKYHVVVAAGEREDDPSELVEFRDEETFREYLVYCLLKNDYFNSTVLLDDAVIRAYDHTPLKKLIARARAVRRGCAVAIVVGGEEMCVQ